MNDTEEERWLLSFDGVQGDEDGDKRFELLCVSHSKMVNLMKDKFLKIAMVGVYFQCITFLKYNVLILYMRTFYSNTFIISIVIGFGTLSNGVFGLIFGYIGDSWKRFDHLIVICCIIDVICYSFQAFAPSFLIFSIFYILGTMPLVTIVNGYVTYMLPIYNAKNVIGITYQLSTIFILISPIIGALIGYYISYQMTFCLVSILSFLCLIYCLFIIFNKQNDLELMQLSMIDTHYKHYNLSNDNINNINNNEELKLDSKNIQWLYDKEFRFPLCLLKQEKEEFEEEKKNELILGYHDDDDDDNKQRFFEKWLVVIIITITHGLVFANGTQFAVWYTVYMYDKYNYNIVLSTCQFLIQGLFVGIGMQFIQYFKDKSIVNVSNINNINDKKYNFGNLWVKCCIIPNFFMIILLAVLFPNNLLLNVFDFNGYYIYNGLYWLYHCILGICFGMSIMSQEFIILETQPKDGKGTTAGWRTMTIETSISIGYFVIGFLWDYSYNWLFYYQAIIVTITSFIVILLAILQSY